MTAHIDLYWLPLGAGGHCVRLNGKVFEAASALLERRSRCDIYHSGLEVRIGAERHTIEMGPVWNVPAPDRGVVGEGAVGSRRLYRLRAFRYEIRCWRDGRIPDAAEAVDSPIRVSQDPACARAVLARIRTVPLAVWGRDDLGTGEMWNSNSVVSFVLATSGVDVRAIPLPAGGRAPGWDAGIAVAERLLGAGALEPVAHGDVPLGVLA